MPESFFDFEEEDDHGNRPVSPLLRLQMFCAESNRSYVFPVKALEASCSVLLSSGDLLLTDFEAEGGGLSSKGDVVELKGDPSDQMAFQPVSFEVVDGCSCKRKIIR